MKSSNKYCHVYILYRLAWQLLKKLTTRKPTIFSSKGVISSEVEQNSDCVSEGATDVSDDENASSSSRLTSKSRLCQKGTFHPKLFQFESKDYGISNLNGGSPIGFFKLFFDRRLIQTIVDETTHGVNFCEKNAFPKCVSSCL